MARKLTPPESALIAKLVSGTPDESRVLQEISAALVEEMNDGRMGSLQFCPKRNSLREFGRKIGEARFYDEDGVLVSATLNFDQDDELFELDVWKVDFSRLKRYPEAEAIEIVHQA